MDTDASNLDINSVLSQKMFEKTVIRDFVKSLLSSTSVYEQILNKNIFVITNQISKMYLLVN